LLVADIQLGAVQYTQIGKCMAVKWNKANLKFITYYSLVQGIALTFKPRVSRTLQILLASQKQQTESKLKQEGETFVHWGILVFKSRSYLYASKMLLARTPQDLEEVEAICSLGSDLRV